MVKSIHVCQLNQGLGGKRFWLQAMHMSLDHIGNLRLLKNSETAATKAINASISAFYRVKRVIEVVGVDLKSMRASVTFRKILDFLHHT